MDTFIIRTPLYSEPVTKISPWFPDNWNLHKMDTSTQFSTGQWWSLFKSNTKRRKNSFRNIEVIRFVDVWFGWRRMEYRLKKPCPYHWGINRFIQKKTRPKLLMYLLYTKTSKMRTPLYNGQVFVSRRLESPFLWKLYITVPCSALKSSPQYIYYIFFLWNPL